MNKFKALGLYLSQNFYRIVAAVILHTFYRIEYIGKNNIPKEYGCVIAINHSSFLDAPLVGSSIFGKVFRFMARDTLFASLLANILLRSMGALPIKRSAIDRKAWDIFIQLIKSGQHVLIFPEGTRTPNGQLQQGKAGAGMVVYKTKAKVIPVYVHGTFEAWPKGKKFPNFFKKLTVVYGSPIDFSEYFDKEENKATYQEITDRIMKEIKKLEKSLSKKL
jgi:1-acyl-sn-glycerol-3-phosphate acyltransferase